VVVFHDVHVVFHDVRVVFHDACSVVFHEVQGTLFRILVPPFPRGKPEKKKKKRRENFAFYPVHSGIP